MLFDDPEEQPQRVCVSAGAGGLGWAIATRFHEAGAQVHLCDLSAQAVAQALASHPGIHGTVADVADSAGVAGFIGEALDWMGGIDVLVNCAGEVGPRSPIEEVDEATWHRVLDVNLTGMFHCVRHAVPTMKDQRSGCILNLGATAARTGLPLRTPFVAAKAAVLGFTQNLARELGPDNIRCNAILPGVIDNPKGRLAVENRARDLRQSYEEAEAGLLEYVSMRSWIAPEEVADTVFFLASPEARHVSGQTIGVCGNLEWDR